MARGRFISKETALDKRVNELSDDTCRFAWVMLIANADVNGNMHGDPIVVRSMLFPRRKDVSGEQMAGYIDEWKEKCLVIEYEGDDGDVYLHLKNFDKHQVGLRKNREEAQFPNMPEDGGKDAGELPEDGGKDGGELPESIPPNIKLKVKLSKEEVKEKEEEEEEEKKVEVNVKGGGGSGKTVDKDCHTDILVNKFVLLFEKLRKEKTPQANMGYCRNYFGRLIDEGVTVNDFEKAWRWYTGKHGCPPGELAVLKKPILREMAMRLNAQAKHVQMGETNGEFDKYIHR